MKKLLVLVLFIIGSFFVFTNDLQATTVKVKINSNNVSLRQTPSTKGQLIKSLAIASSYKLVEANIVADQGGCKNGWYHIYYSGVNEGYVCSDYVELVTMDQPVFETTNECEVELANSGFPKSYWSSLCALKEKYPNWNFEADITGIDYMTAVSKESVVGKSLIQTSYEGYLSIETQSYDFLTDTFTVKEGKNWYAANSDVVSYYMDPRNFLDEKYIFMFEKLSYDETYQNKEAVEAILSGRDIVAHSQTILDAALGNNINAIYLASKIRQETGGNYTNYSLAGNSITVNNILYNNVYNPYNIGANTGAHDGLVWAVSGTTYLRPWINLGVAINGGAQLIASTYINKGQDTIYYQKFNTSSYSSYAPFAHQYMTNIRGAASEASIAYEGYKKMEVLNNTAFTFVIPVYEDMSEETYKLPEPGNPNNHLSNIKINNIDLKNFAHDKFEYTYYTAIGTVELDVSATSINNGAVVSGIGKIPLTDNETIIEIIVTAENKSVQKYIVKVIKTEGLDLLVKDIVEAIDLPVVENNFLLSPGYTLTALSSKVHKVSSNAKIEINNKKDDLLFTGDVVVITNGSDTQSYNIVIKGDTNNDGNINVQDLLRVQKYILGYTDLAGTTFKAADINQDGVVNVVDLLKIQKHILGYVKIS